jgi:hypothetical protein
MLTDKQKKMIIIPGPHPINAGAEPSGSKPEKDPFIPGSGTESRVSRKSAEFPLFSIFLASIVPHAGIEILNL